MLLHLYYNLPKSEWKVKNNCELSTKHFGTVEKCIIACLWVRQSGMLHFKVRSLFVSLVTRKCLISLLRSLFLMDCCCWVIKLDMKILWSAFLLKFNTNVDIVSYILPFACRIRHWSLNEVDILFNEPQPVFNKDKSVDCFCCFFLTFPKGSRVLSCLHNQLDVQP